MWEDTWMTKRTKASQVYREDQGYFHSSPTTLASRNLADSWVSCFPYLHLEFELHNPYRGCENPPF